MKFLNINATISVKPQFSGEVLKAGTPLDISGNEANSDAAVGIVASDTAVGAESIAIVTEGTIDITELTASYGSALTDECIAALKGITFLYGGKAVVPSGGGGGFVVNATQDESDSDVWTFDHTPAEVEAALAAGTPAIMLVHWSNGVTSVANPIRDCDMTFAVLLSQDSDNFRRFRVKKNGTGDWLVENSWYPILPLLDNADTDCSEWVPIMNGPDSRMYIEPINVHFPLADELAPYLVPIWSSMVDGKTCVAMPLTDDLLESTDDLITAASKMAHRGRGTMLTDVFGFNDTYQVFSTANTVNTETGNGHKAMYAVGTFADSDSTTAKIVTVELHFEVNYQDFEAQYGWLIIRMTEESATIMS